MALPSLGSLEMPYGSAHCGDLRVVVRITESVSHVHRRCGTFEDAECANNGRGHAIMRLIDLEVLQRAFRLGAPILV